MYAIFINQRLRRAGDQPAVVVSILRNGAPTQRKYTHEVTLPDGAKVTSKGILLPDGRKLNVDQKAIKQHAPQPLVLEDPAQPHRQETFSAWDGIVWRTCYAPLPGPPLKNSLGVRLWVEADSVKFDAAAPTMATSHFTESKQRKGGQ